MFSYIFTRNIICNVFFLTLKVASSPWECKMVGSRTIKFLPRHQTQHLVQSKQDQTVMHGVPNPTLWANIFRYESFTVAEEFRYSLLPCQLGETLERDVCSCF